MKNDDIIQDIKTTMAVEGMFLDRSDIDLIDKFLNNEITEKEGIEKIKSEFSSLK